MSKWQVASDPLLRREMENQVQLRSSGKHWSYPGPALFLLVTLFPPLLLFIDKSSESSRAFLSGHIFILSSILQMWLCCLRAMISCSVSMAKEVKERTLPILRSTPLGVTQIVLTKLGANLFPLSIELSSLLLFNLALYSGYAGLSPATVFSTLALTASSTLFYGCFGLWLGMLVGDPERAANNSRAVVVMALAGSLLLEKALPWPLLVISALIWLCLVVQPQARPGQAYQGGVTALVLLLLFPSAWMASQNLLPQFQLLQYNPLVSVLYQEHVGLNTIIYLTLAISFFLFTVRRVRQSL